MLVLVQLSIDTKRKCVCQSAVDTYTSLFEVCVLSSSDSRAIHLAGIRPYGNDMTQNVVKENSQRKKIVKLTGVTFL